MYYEGTCILFGTIIFIIKMTSNPYPTSINGDVQ